VEETCAFPSQINWTLDCAVLLEDVGLPACLAKLNGKMDIGSNMQIVCL
jgi:hypothetical protein